MLNNDVLQVSLLLYGHGRDGGVCSVPFDSELVIFVSFEDLVSPVDVDYATIDVGRQLSKNLHMFSKLMLLQDALFGLQRQILHLLVYNISDPAHAKPAASRAHSAFEPGTAYEHLRTLRPESPCHHLA